MFDLENEVGFDAGDGGEEVIEDLLGGHPEFAAAGGDFQPAVLVAVVAFGKIFGAHQDEVAVVGQFHNGDAACGRTMHSYAWVARRARELSRRAA